MSFPLIFLLGPTAVGKTNCSFYLAQKLSAGILNCDSIQMYKSLNIGSDKPVSHIKQKKFPFFLFDIWEPPFICTAGDFKKKALAVLKSELPYYPLLAVGGSGFYIQALEKGMYPIKKIDPNIEQMLTNIQKKRGPAHLYQLLKFLDPIYAQKISSQDSYRVFRGICIILSERQSLSVVQSRFKKQKLPYPYLKIGLYLPREILLKNVQIRVDKMLQKGLLEEVQDLINRQLIYWPPMRSAGYKECVLFLQKTVSKNNLIKPILSKEELKQRIITRTMQLVKKQMSWFKRDSNIQWFLSEESNKLKIYETIKQTFHL